ncbi:hypothetical protein [Acidovorax kalamii]|nr:hypothetical protein [Acidovorax kalamii]
MSWDSARAQAQGTAQCSVDIGDALVAAGVALVWALVKMVED